MIIRFFLLQAHYRSTLDFSNEALQASEKGLARLMKAVEMLPGLPVSDVTTVAIAEWKSNCDNALNDDLNTPILISHLFDMVRIINLVAEGREKIMKADLDALIRYFDQYIFDILGLRREVASSVDSKVLPQVMELLLNLRQEAKKNKDFALSDRIRDELGKIGIAVKDTKDGADWEIKMKI